MTYEDLLEMSDKESLIVREKKIPGYGGRIYRNRIAINRDLTQTEKACVLAEELGHYHTTTGNILDQTDTGNQKQEYRARLYGYNLKIGLMGIVHAYEHGCKSRHDTAAYLDVTEEYLTEALAAYRRKYGCGIEFDNYIIMFEPYLAVIRKLEFSL